MSLSFYLKQDLLFYINSYLELIDILSFRSSCQSFYALLSHDIFWLDLIHHRVYSIQRNIKNCPITTTTTTTTSTPTTAMAKTRQWANQFLKILKLQNFFHLFCFFSNFSFPFLSSYGRILSLSRDASVGIYEYSDQAYRGGLMRISYQSNNNILSIESSEDQWLYEVQYRSHQVIVCDSHSNHIYTIKCFHGSYNRDSMSSYENGNNTSTTSHQTQLHFYNLENQLVYQYHPLQLEDITTPLPFQHFIPQHDLPPMNKLYNGVYGPHGLETVYVSFERYQHLSSSIIHRLPSRGNWETCEYVIIGRKITGDANVPAQQISFILNPLLVVNNISRLAQSKSLGSPSFPHHPLLGCNSALPRNHICVS